MRRHIPVSWLGGRGPHPGPTLAQLKALTREHPERAAPWLSRAKLSLEPERLEASVSLSAVYQALGRREDAVRVYDRALALRAPRGAAGLRALIEKDRRRLAGC